MTCLSRNIKLKMLHKIANNPFRYLLGIAFLAWCLPLRAQWSGSVDLMGGFGGLQGNIANNYDPMYHGLLQGEFQLHYKTDFFSWNTSINGKWEPNTTDKVRFDFNDNKISALYKYNTTNPLTSNLKSDFLWTPSKDRRYSAWILYQYANNRDNLHTLKGKGDLESWDQYTYYNDVHAMDEHKVGTGFKTYRSFNEGHNILQSSLAAQMIHNNTRDTWTTSKSGDLEHIDSSWSYLSTYGRNTFNIDGDIFLKNTLIDKTAKLYLTPGVRLAATNVLEDDRSTTRFILGDETATLQDSISLQDRFNFWGVSAVPFLAADFSWKSIEIHADYGADIYARRINDDTCHKPMSLNDVAPVGRAKVKWTISPKHSLSLTNQLSVNHPDYDKLCWYDRTVDYIDQIYKGNDQLLSPHTRRYALEYEFKQSRFFAQSSIAYTCVDNAIDKTWAYEDIDEYRFKVFHWVNASDNRSVGFTQKLGWRGKIIEANAVVAFNLSKLTPKNVESPVKKNFDWRFNADIAAHLGKGWSVAADAFYKSKTITYYSSQKSRFVLNVRAQKDFKQFSLFLEGRDLLDQTITTNYESEDQKDYWIEENRANRRAVVLGFQWRF